MAILNKFNIYAQIILKHRAFSIILLLKKLKILLKKSQTLLKIPNTRNGKNAAIDMGHSGSFGTGIERLELLNSILQLQFSDSFVSIILHAVYQQLIHLSEKIYCLM